MKFLQQQQHVSITSALTPLVDIIFLLIIFFLVSSTFEKSEKNLGIQLPSSKGKSLSKKKKSEQWIYSINREGKVFFNQQLSSLGAVELQLKKEKSKRKRVQIILKADNQVHYGIVAKFLGLFSEYGFSKVAFQTIDEK